MSVHGSVTGIPSGQFAFTRRYITRVTFGFGAGVTYTQANERFVFTDSFNPFVHVVANLQPSLWGTRSNSLTLDHVLVDWYLLLDPDPTPQNLPVSIQYEMDPVDGLSSLFIFIGGWTTRYRFPIPHSPPGYWLPDL